MTKEISELELLKNRAKSLGITFHPNIGLLKLKEKIETKMHEVGDKSEFDSGEYMAPDAEQLKNEYIMKKQKEAGELIRIRLTCLDPNKKDWPGEPFSTGNSVVGFYKKYIPYGSPWHVPKIIVDMLKTKDLQTFYTVTDAKGRKTKRSKMIKAYNVEELPNLTTREMEELAKAQRASGRLEE